MKETLTAVKRLKRNSYIIYCEMTRKKNGLLLKRFYLPEVREASKLLSVLALVPTQNRIHYIVKWTNERTLFTLFTFYLIQNKQ